MSTLNSSTHGVQLHIARLQKSFGEQPVLRGIELDVKPGEFIAVIGRSGCGKSTLLRVIAGLEPSTSGEIWINDQPVQHVHPETRMMFQDARLLPWNKVIDNVAIGLRKEDRHKAEAALEQVGLGARANEWPSVLSGGQKQRVALARALASHPKLLLLDEPLGALDALTRIEMQQLIEWLWQQQQFTTVLITHDVEEAVLLADRVVLIEEGSIAMDRIVPFSRPRQRGNAEVAAFIDKILKRVMGITEVESRNEAEDLPYPLKKGS
ncbi:Aliphatic sulfonates import ATP-binding protein SsuB [Paenibacillus sp. GM2FR]|uniref:ATP-binding cassette domain-containing protein n=1 Tax=Paenibacillus sp. GM2FR TaxID=2059268 RepID=UPI000C279AE5|nr:ATP-binding cassette domain-containing protein [Paenibacillus sp. GM2FR]PJN50217.1 Aliphatic sulfonates import ATP-binding protein SsuB [Paenibacillus sp. GM2FR]